MFDSRIATPLLITATMFCPGAASAWWDGGHKLVAQIAYEELTPEQRTWFAELIEQNPAEAEMFAPQLAEELGTTVEPDARMRWLFSQAAIWADMVRDKKLASTEIYQRFSRDSRHFTDAPYFPRQSDQTALPEHAHLPESAWRPGMIEPLNELNSLQIIAKARAEIPDRTIDPAERSLDLLWLMHVVGDVHQPCHNVTLFISPALPNGDRGANQIFVFGIKSLNPAMRSEALHAYWDSYGSELTNTQAQTMERLAALKKLAPLWTEGRERAKITDTETWWKEGFGLAKSEVYAPILQKILRAKAQPNPAGKNKADIVMIDLTHFEMDNYASNVRRVSERQIVTAGLRLGAVLKEIYEKAMAAQ